MKITYLTQKVFLSVFKRKINKTSAKNIGQVINEQKKADQRLTLLYLADTEFINYINKIRKRWNITKISKDEFNMYKNVSNFENKLKENYKKEFVNNITKTLQDFNFGNEWFETMKQLVVTGVYDPPPYNCYLDIREINGRNRVILEANEFTTKDDIEGVMTTFLAMRDKLYKIPKKNNSLAKTFDRDLKIYSKYIKHQSSEEIGDKIFGELDTNSFEEFARIDKQRKERMKKAVSRINKRLQFERKLRKN